MALNAQTLEGQWNAIQGKLHERWGVLTDDDLQRARGNVEQLVGIIQQKTGETREAVRGYLEELVDDGASTMRRAADAVRDFAATATDSVQNSAHQATDSVLAGMRESREVIQQHPIESVVACFGVGIVTGVILGTCIRSH